VWQSPDPILAKYLPSGDKERDAKLPGMGGVQNSKNLAMYTYSHQNPVKYVDPDGNEAAPKWVLFILQPFTDVGKKEHYSRNENQPNPPKTIKQLPKDQFESYGKTPTHNLGATKDNVDIRGKVGKKFEGHQYVYDEKSGKLDKTDLNMGSFDKVSPTKDPAKHSSKDVVPWLMWGNTEKDPSTFFERTEALVETILRGPVTPEPVK